MSRVDFSFPPIPLTEAQKLGLLAATSATSINRYATLADINASGSGIPAPGQTNVPSVAAWDTSNLQWSNSGTLDISLANDQGGSYWINVYHYGPITGTPEIRINNNIHSNALTLSNEGIHFGDGSFMSSASSAYDQSLNTTDNVTFNQVNFNNGTSLAKGSFDTYVGGYGGISLNCAVGYELNWQAGVLSSSYANGLVNIPIYFGSTLEFQSESSYGILFADGSFQSTASGSGGPGGYNQSLNTIDNVIFNSVRTDLNSNTITFTAIGLVPNGLTPFDSGYYEYGPNGITLPQGMSTGVKFGDGTYQQTAAYSYNQSLNTTDSPQFNTLSLVSTTDTNYQIQFDPYSSQVRILYANQAYAILGPDSLHFGDGNGWPSTNYSWDGITFADGSYQSTAVGNHYHQTGAGLSGGSGSSINHGDYPDEIVININGVEYAVPARAI